MENEIPKGIRKLLEGKNAPIEKEELAEEASKVNPFAEPEPHYVPKQVDSSELAPEELQAIDDRLARLKKYDDIGLEPFPVQAQAGAPPDSGGNGSEMPSQEGMPKEGEGQAQGDQNASEAESEPKNEGYQDNLESQSGETTMCASRLGKLNHVNTHDDAEMHLPKAKVGSNPTDSNALRSLSCELEEERVKNEALRKGYEKIAEDQGYELPDNFWKGEPNPEVEQQLAYMQRSLAKAEQEIKQKDEALKNRPQSMPNPQEPPWVGKNVRILFPCMKTTNPVTALCLAALVGEFGLEKIGFDMLCGDSLIYHARNKLADRFLKSESEWSMWFDDDIIPPIGRPSVIREQTSLSENEFPDRLLKKHVLKDLMKHGHKLIGGTYFGRRSKSPAMFAGGIDNPGDHRSAKKGEERVIATNWVATGCLLVHRDVYLAIQKKFPELAPTKTRQYWDYFKPGYGFDDGQGGEDESFCRRAKEAGFQPHVDTSIACLHVGYASYGLHNTSYPLFDGRGALPF